MMDSEFSMHLNLNQTVPFCTHTNVLFDQEERLQEVEEELKLAKFEYFQQQLLYNAFREVINDLHLNNVKSYSAQDQTLRLMEKRMSACEALNYLRKNGGDVEKENEGFLLNLKTDDVKKHMDEIILDEGVLRIEIMPLINQKIVNKGLKLLSFLMESDKCNKIAALPNFVADIRKKTTSVDEMAKNNQILSASRHQIFKDYFIELGETFNVLIKVTEEFPLNYQLTNIEMRVKVGSEKLKLIANEFEQLKMVLHQKTYTPDQLKALKRLRNTIGSKKTELDYEIYDMQSQLNSYLELGSKFLKLAEEFSQVKSDLDILKWAEERYL